MPVIDLPDKPEDSVLKADDYGLEKAIYLEDRKTALRRQQKLKIEIGQLYDELWEQCSLELRAKLKGEEGFAAAQSAHNPLELRNRIKGICCGFASHKMKYYALTQATKKLTLFYQKPHMSNEEYKQQFDALWDTVVQFGGSVTNHPNLINAQYGDSQREQPRGQ